MGGMGGGGQGESEIALHRSRLQRQEKKLRIQIDEVIRTRNMQRRGRKRNRVPVIAVIGYTNAGTPKQYAFRNRFCCSIYCVFYVF